MRRTHHYFLSLLFCATTLGTRAQNVNFSAKEASIQEVFNAIKEQTGYTVFANSQLLAQVPKISIQAKNIPLAAFLNQTLGTKVGYTIEGKTIVLTDINQGNQQHVTIKGKVVDTQGNPVSNATVMNMMIDSRGTAQTMTNNKGDFSISAKRGDVLVISFVGYKPYHYSVANTIHQPTIQLSIDQTSLQELVVVGYGSMQRKDLTGSVATVKGEVLQDAPFMTVDNALAGKVAGVEVSKSDGTPGGAVRIRIRGTSSLLGGNDPLYVIDGVPVQIQSNYINPGFDISSPAGNDVSGSGGVAAGMSAAFINGLNGLNGLNPEDIESISVLKDASAAAIYGSKASNGVVIITTKRGANNMKPQISAGYYATVTTPILPKVLNAKEYRQLVSEAANNSYTIRKALNDYIPADLDMVINNPDAYFGTANTDWLGAVTRNTVSHNAEMNIQGGSETSKYYTSLVYNKTPGVLIASDYERIAGKINFENRFGRKFTTLLNVNIGNITQNITNGIYSQAVRARPDWGIYDENGAYLNFSTMGESYNGFQNPVALSNALNESGTFSVMGSLSGIYDIKPYLQFKSIVSLNRQTYNQRLFTPSYLSTGGYVSASSSDAIGSNANSNLTNWFIENVLTFNKAVGSSSNLNVMVGTSYETYKRSFFSTTASGYPDDTFLTSLSSAVTPLYVSGDNPSKPQSYLVSFYMRGNYNLLSKYLFTFTGRSDGSSKFGTDNKWGFFPSGAFAWRISEEKFLKSFAWLSDLKFRTSYGLIGNQNIGDQMYRTLYTPLSYGGSNALVPTQIGNESIKWETTKEFNVGGDLALFRNRLLVTFDYYDKRTEGALLSLPIAPSAAYATLLSNSVGIKNSGYELSLDGTIMTKSKFSWGGSFNITWNKSLITDLADDAPLSQIGNMAGVEMNNTTLIEGKPLGLITGRYVEGIIRTQEQLDEYKAKMGMMGSIFYPYLGIGDPMYRLNDGDSFGATPLQQEIIAEAAPKFYGGFNQNFKYDRIGLQMYFTYSYGGKLLWGDHVSSVQFVNKSSALTEIFDRYYDANPNASQPRLLYGSDGSYTKTNLDVFNSSFLKLRTLVLNYDLTGANLAKKLKARQLGIFLSAMNLFTITKYPGNDPETSNDPYSAIGGYFDLSNYPVTRTFSMGFKASF